MLFEPLSAYSVEYTAGCTQFLLINNTRNVHKILTNFCNEQAGLLIKGVE